MFSAVDTQTNLGVVIKVNTNTSVNNFEAKVLHEIKNKNLKGSVKIIEHGVLPEECHKYGYIVMERLGKSLKELIKENKKIFSVKTVCQMGINLIENLREVHSLGFLHLDLKPDNILYDANYHVKICDFGEAKLFATLNRQ